MDVKLIYNKVYETTLQAFTDEKNFIVHRGGTGSGKTYEIVMFILLNICLSKPNKIITIVSESYPHLKRGVMRVTAEIIKKIGISVPFNETDKIYKFTNGTILEFVSADRLGSSLGNRRYLLYGNEINHLKKEVYDEMARRSEIVLSDFNPTAEFWLEDLLKFYDKSIVIKSNYLSNTELPQHEKDKIKKRASMDPNFKRIHIDCEYGNSEGLVFKPEQIILIDEFPKDLKYKYGQDFGFTAPATMMKTFMNEDSVFIDEIYYKTGMLEPDYKTELLTIEKHIKITSDSEAPDKISFIKNLGYNIFATKKGKGSVKDGIEKLQARKIYITKRSINTIKEFRELTHAVDKYGKNIDGEYVGEDHAIDGVRYSQEDYNAKKPSFGIGGISY